MRLFILISASFPAVQTISLLMKKSLIEPVRGYFF